MDSVARSFRSLRSIGDLGDKTDYDTADTASLSYMMKPWEYVITPDHFGCWKRHVAWAKSDGKTLRENTTQRFASSMVFISLLLNANLVILYNSSDVCTRVRRYLDQGAFHRLEFYIGLVLIVSVFCTLFAILATFTVWGMVSVISDENAVCVIRSSIGQYATQLPSRLVASSLLLFISWSAMYLFILLPPWVAIIGLLLGVSIYLHIVSVYSAFGRLLMHSGAMGSKPIITQTEEQSMLPADMHERLGECAGHHLERKTSVTAQYIEKNTAEQEDKARRRSSSKYYHMIHRAALAKVRRFGELSESATTADIEQALSGAGLMPEEVIFAKDQDISSRLTWDSEENGKKNKDLARDVLKRRGGRVDGPHAKWNDEVAFTLRRDSSANNGTVDTTQSLETLEEAYSADNLTACTGSQGSESPRRIVREAREIKRQGHDDETSDDGRSGNYHPKAPRMSDITMDTYLSKSSNPRKSRRTGFVEGDSGTFGSDDSTVDERRQLLMHPGSYASAPHNLRYS